jgi:hypothetical protein
MALNIDVLSTPTLSHPFSYRIGELSEAPIVVIVYRLMDFGLARHYEGPYPTTSSSIGSPVEHQQYCVALGCHRYAAALATQ